MKKMIQGVQAELAAFIERQEHLLLVASCSNEDTALVLKILRDMEQLSDDLFLLFADPFEDLPDFVSLVVERLRAEHCLADEALQQAGEQPLPPMPEELFDETQPPVQRLFDAMMFARGLLPAGEGRRLIWAMMPTAIHDRAGYLELLGALAPRSVAVQPWMSRLRLIVRDDADTVVVAPQLLQAQLTRVLPLDLGPAAIERSLAEEAEDQALPVPERMQSLLTLALLDYAHKRYDFALERFNFLLGYYQSTDEKAMQAVVLNGIGDIYHREEQLDKAQEWYETAVPPAVDGGAPVVFFTVVKNLGDVAYKQGRYEEAAQLFDSAEQLATHLLDPEAKARMLEWRGLSEEQQGKLPEAIHSWETAVDLCRALGLDVELGDNLGHLERVYQQHGVRDKAAAVRAEREEARRRLEEEPA